MRFESTLKVYKLCIFLKSHLETNLLLLHKLSFVYINANCHYKNTSLLLVYRLH